MNPGLFLFRMQMRILSCFSQTKKREYAGLKHWFKRLPIEKILTHGHYHHFFTAHFGFDDGFYSSRRILDIGCGPRGSLEWAGMALERIGLDPLSHYYRHFGTNRHGMRYVKAPAERIPFPDGHFDIVSSFNSLDHVVDLGRVIGEIGRVTTSGGYFLLLADVGHEPNIREPHCLSWDTAALFKSDFDVLEEKQYELQDGDMYWSIRKDQPFNHADSRSRTGVLSAKMRRR
jgi:SAM-dependent methyltransferase